MDVLRTLYTGVVPLEDWLYTVDTPGSLRTKLRQHGDTDSYKALLKSVYVCTCTKGRCDSFTQELHCHLQEVVLGVIRKILTKSGPQGNVLTYGCTLASPARFPFGIDSFSPNSILARLLSPDWETLHDRIGDEILTHLLEKTSVFEGVGAGCFIQFAGVPIHEMWPYGKGVTLKVKTDSTTCKSDTRKVRNTGTTNANKMVERLVSKHRKQNKPKAQKSEKVKKNNCWKKKYELISDPKYEALRNVSEQYWKKKSFEAERMKSGEVDRLSEVAAYKTDCVASSSRKRDASMAGLDNEADGFQSKRIRKMDGDRAGLGNELDSFQSVARGNRSNPEYECRSMEFCSENEAKSKVMEVVNDDDINISAVKTVVLDTGPKSDIVEDEGKLTINSDRVHVNQVQASSTVKGRNGNSPAGTSSCTKKSFKPFNHSVTVPRNKVLYYRNVRQRIPKSELMAAVEPTPEGILKLYRAIFETTIHLTEQTVRLMTPNLNKLARVCCPGDQSHHPAQAEHPEDVIVVGSSGESVLSSGGHSARGHHSSSAGGGHSSGCHSSSAGGGHSSENSLLKDHPSFGDSSMERMLGSCGYTWRNSGENVIAKDGAAFTDGCKVSECEDELLGTSNSGVMYTAVPAHVEGNLRCICEICMEKKNTRTYDTVTESLHLSVSLENDCKLNNTNGQIDVDEEGSLTGQSSDRTGDNDGISEVHGDGVASGRASGDSEGFDVTGSDAVQEPDLGSDGDSGGFGVTGSDAVKEPDVGSDGGDSEGFDVNVETMTDDVCPSPETVIGCIDTEMDVVESDGERLVLKQSVAPSKDVVTHDLCECVDASQVHGKELLNHRQEGSKCSNEDEQEISKIICTDKNDVPGTEILQEQALIIQADSKEGGHHIATEPACGLKPGDDGNTREISIPALDNVVPLLKDFIERHRKCPYHALVKYHCPVKLLKGGYKGQRGRCINRTAAGKSRTKLSTEKLVNSYSSKNQVYVFLKKCLVKTLPVELLGSVHNRNVLLKNVSVFVSLKKYDKISIGELMRGMKTSDVPWLDQIRPNSCRLLLLACLVYWLVTRYVLVIIKTFFYVTDTTFLRYQLLYFRQNVWLHLHMNGIQELIKKKMLMRMTKGLVQEWLSKKSALGVSSLRFLPKKKSLRPIVNMQFVDSNFANQKYSINSKLGDTHQILTWLKARNPGLMGCGKLGQQEVHASWSSFVQHWRSTGSPNMYWVKSDISKCYDSIMQHKLLSILEKILMKEMGSCQYAVRKYFMLWACKGKVKRVYKKSVHVDLVEPDFMSFCRNQIQQNGLRNAIFVDKVTFARETCHSLLTTLKAHLLCNIIQVSSQYFKQNKGISQGSAVSTILCSIYYMQMEREMFDVGRDDLLLRMVDDYLYVTPSWSKAVNFLLTVLKGIPEYNCIANQDKMLTNFAVPDIDDQVPRETSGKFPWCGLLFNTKTLEVGSDFTRYVAVSISSTMTYDMTKEPGCVMKEKLRYSARQRCTALILDDSVNSRQQILQNIYYIFLLVAFKFHSSLRRFRQRAGNPRFLLGIVFAMRSCVASQIRKRKVTDLGNKRTQDQILLWLCLKAFLLKLKQHRGQYSCLLDCCQAYLGQTEQNLDERIWIELMAVAGGGMPEEFGHILP